MEYHFRNHRCTMSQVWQMIDWLMVILVFVCRHQYLTYPVWEPLTYFTFKISKRTSRPINLTLSSLQSLFGSLIPITQPDTRLPCIISKSQLTWKCLDPKWNVVSMEKHYRGIVNAVQSSRFTNTHAMSTLYKYNSKNPLSLPSFQTN